MRNQELNRNFRSQSGQAVIEYVLVLVIVVSILTGILFQFSSAFRTYTKALFGDYISCLLEAGELPGSSIACSESMPSWKAIAAAANLDTKGGSSSSSSSSGSRSDSGRPKSDSSRNAANKSSDANKSANAESGSRGSVSSGESLSSGNKSRSGSGSKEGGPDQKEDSGNKASVTKLGPVSPMANQKSDAKVAIPLSASYLSAEEEKKREKPNRVVLGKADDSLRPSQSKYALPNRKPASVMNESEGFSFGDILRILMIIIILIAVVVFFGGQIMNYSRSQEK